jgi:hypothetical protein
VSVTPGVPAALSTARARPRAACSTAPAVAGRGAVRRLLRHRAGLRPCSASTDAAVAGPEEGAPGTDSGAPPPVSRSPAGRRRSGVPQHPALTLVTSPDQSPQATPQSPLVPPETGGPGPLSHDRRLRTGLLPIRPETSRCEPSTRAYAHRGRASGLLTLVNNATWFRVVLDGGSPLLQRRGVQPTVLAAPARSPTASTSAGGRPRSCPGCVTSSATCAASATRWSRSGCPEPAMDDVPRQCGQPGGAAGRRA